MRTILLTTFVLVTAFQSSDEWFGRGINAFNKGAYNEALLMFSRAVEADTTSVSARFNRATAYVRLQRYGEAINDLNWCLSRQPDRIAHRMQRAVAYAESGQTLASIADLDVIIAADSVFPKARLLRGRQLMRADPTRACVDLNAALAAGDSTAQRFIDGNCR